MLASPTEVMSITGQNSPRHSGLPRRWAWLLSERLVVEAILSTFIGWDQVFLKVGAAFCCVNYFDGIGFFYCILELLLTGPAIVGYNALCVGAVTFAAIVGVMRLGLVANGSTHLLVYCQQHDYQ